MTFGPNPVPPGPNPAPGFPPVAPANPPAKAALLAPTGPSSQRRLIISVVAGVAGLLLIIGSFLTWASVDETDSSGGITASVQISISGMGSGDVTLEGMDDSGFGTDSITAQMEQSIEDEAAKNGIWTLIFGILILAGGALIAVRRYPGIGAAVVGVVGLASTIAAIVFVADPAGAVGDGDTGDVDVGAGVGLWLVLVGALLGLLAGAAALAVTLRPAQYDDAAPAPLAAPGFGPQGFGQPQGFGGPQAPQGYGGPQAPQAPQGFGQPQAPGAPGPQGYTGQPPQGFGGPQGYTGQPPQGQPPQGQPPQA